MEERSIELGAAEGMVAFDLMVSVFTILIRSGISNRSAVALMIDGLMLSYEEQLGYPHLTPPQVALLTAARKSADRLRAVLEKVRDRAE
jgi:hypothetical protein